MNDKLKILYNPGIILIFYSVYIAALLCFLIPSAKSIMPSITILILFITGAALLVILLPKIKTGFIYWCFIMLALIFLLEIINLNSGLKLETASLIFIPFTAAFNWILIIAGSIFIAKQIDKNIWITALLAGTLAVLFEVMLEPAAIKLGYWKWENGAVPLYNYYAWFFVAFAGSIIYDAMKIKTGNKILEQYYFIQLLFFVLVPAVI